MTSDERRVAAIRAWLSDLDPIMAGSPADHIGWLLSERERLNGFVARMCRCADCPAAADGGNAA